MLPPTWLWPRQPSLGKLWQFYLCAWTVEMLEVKSPSVNKNNMWIMIPWLGRNHIVGSALPIVFQLFTSGRADSPEWCYFWLCCPLDKGSLTVDDPSNPSVLWVKLKASKIDPFCSGIFMFIGKNSSDLCPVAATVNYLGVWHKKQGPPVSLCIWPLATWWERLWQQWDALGMAGIECSRYSGYSFWIGVATTAAAREIEDSIIKMLGRWKSLHT